MKDRRGEYPVDSWASLEAGNATGVAFQGLGWEETGMGGNWDGGTLPLIASAVQVIRIIVPRSCNPDGAYNLYCSIGES